MACSITGKSYKVHYLQFSSVSQSCLTLYQPQELQHARLPCPSSSTRSCSNSCPSSRWYHSVIFSSCHLLLLLHSIFPGIRIFSKESVLLIRWPKYLSFSFSISHSNEDSGLISFMIDWFDLLAVQGTLKSLPTPQFKIIKSLVLSLLYGPTLTSVHDYWKTRA